jgi:cell wall-associated NlpC family hydrolase
MTGTCTRLWCYARIAVLVGTIVSILGVSWFGSVAMAHGPKKYVQKRRHIEKRARKMIGVRYSYGGGSPGGFDCSGFTSWVFRGHGATLPHSSDAQFALGDSGAFKRVWKRNHLHTGDLVFFDTTSGRIGHVGIYVGGVKFISATSSRGVQVVSIRDPYYWGPRYVGATRVPALMNPNA